MNLNRRIALAFALLAGVFLALYFAIPAYILHLLANPDGSYLSALLLKHQLKNPVSHTPAYYADFVPAVTGRMLGTIYFFSGLITLLFTRWRKDLENFWRFESTAFNLAVFRLVVIWQVVETSYDPIYQLPGLTWEGLNIPVGYGFLHAVMPPSMMAVTLAMKVFYVLCALGFLGLFTRWTMPLLAAVAFFTQLGPHFVGKIIHYHHLWLGLAILSLSPCGEALSLDYLIARMRGANVQVHRAALRYGRPFVFLWLVIGMIYFFPGFWKFVVGGWDWAFSDNVKYKILAKIFETGEQPQLAFYKYPLLCKLGGFATLIMEMGFIFAIVFPRLRILFVLGAVGFHETNARVMQIGFPSLERFFLTFVNWSRLLTRGKLPASHPRETVPAWKNWAGAVIVGGMICTGFLGIDSWPWAVYPTFAPLEEKFVNSVELQLTEPGGAVRKVLLQSDPTLIEHYTNRTRLRAYLNQVMAEPNEAARQTMLQGLLDLWSKSNSYPAESQLEFWHVLVPLEPPLTATPEPFKLLGKKP